MTDTNENAKSDVDELFDKLDKGLKEEYGMTIQEFLDKIGDDN